MNVNKEFDSKIINNIARNCGEKSVEKSIDYLRIPFYRNKESFKCEIIDDVAFFAGTMCKKHFRLYEMAVLKEFQGKGYGRIMILRIKKICTKYNVDKITLRTSKSGNALGFYLKNNATIVGEKDNDWEVEIKL